MFSRKIRIGYISFCNPKDRFGMSGTSYKIAESLEKMNAEVVYIPTSNPFLDHCVKVVCKLFNL